MSGYADPSRLYFFFDLVSHNAYLAWHKAPELAARHRLTLTPVPVVFGAMLSHYKQLGPAEVPAKSRWMLSNVLRKARLLGIPIAPPASHPFNPLLALRVCCAAHGEDVRLRLIDRLFRATWAESCDVSDPAVLARLLDEAGLPPETLAAARADTVKQHLRHNTDAAIASGVFGVPSWIARGELFWGFDDVEFLEMFLSGRDPLPADRQELRAWMNVRPSVQRRSS